MNRQEVSPLHAHPPGLTSLRIQSTKTQKGDTVASLVDLTALSGSRLFAEFSRNREVNLQKAPGRLHGRCMYPCLYERSKSGEVRQERHPGPCMVGLDQVHGVPDDRDQEADGDDRA